MSMLVFTDLDATLLDHETYAFEDAVPMLAELARRKIPVIPVTSKTRAEVVVWRRRLGLDGPYVTENGAGVFVPAAFDLPPGHDATPDGEDLRLGGYLDYDAIRGAFAALARRFPVRGFGDMTPGEIAGHTGLPAEDCALARRREFSEPFLLDDPDAIAPLERHAAEHGLRVLRGGRFLHLLDARAGKGAAIRMICEVYERLRGERPGTLALGDSPNDLDMLRAADRGVVIPRATGLAPGMDPTGLEVAPHPGPRGWAEAVRRFVG